MLRTLEAFGFTWDGQVVYQSQRTDRYAAALDSLRLAGLTFECSCSRSQLADEERYPGHCHAGPREPGVATATRLRMPTGNVLFTDRVQGMFRQNVAAAVGDIVLRRRDQLFAYVLAVVVDDAAQNVTHVVRGADLLDNTPRQIQLQRLLHMPSPEYSHVPVLNEFDGSKLSKSARSVGLAGAAVLPQLAQVFRLLGLSPPADFGAATVEDAWRWALAEWDESHIPRRLTLSLGR